MMEISLGKWGYFDQIIFNANKTGQRLSLDINTSTKYIYVRKHPNNKNEKATEIMFYECNENWGVRV